MRSITRATFAVALFCTSACTQPAAPVALRGQEVFAQNGSHYAAYMPSAGKYSTPSKYTAPISMGTTQAVPASAISVSELDAPKPSVEVKDVAAPAKTAKIELSKPVEKAEATTTIQTVNPWTKKPRSEFGAK